MSIKVKKSNPTLAELRKLVDNLADRDMKIKRDFQLFEDFFDHFPIPVSMWSSTQDGIITSIKDKGFFCTGAKQIKGLFDCKILKKSVLSDHKKVLAGQNTQSLLKKAEKSYFVSMVSRKDEQDNIIGVSGIAWDVSSNIFIVDILKEIKRSLESNSLTPEDTLEKVDLAIKSSRLNKFLKED